MEKNFRSSPSYVAPTFCYVINGFAISTILMKNSLLENLGQDYIRTAFAKGLPERRVISVHAFRNSLIPIVTGLGSAFGLILAGSFLIEKHLTLMGLVCWVLKLYKQETIQLR